MTGFLLVIALVVLVVFWVVLNNRFQDLERRIALAGGATVTELEMTDLRSRLTRLERYVVDLQRPVVAKEPERAAEPAPAPVKPIVFAEVIAPPVEIPAFAPAPPPKPAFVRMPSPDPEPSGPSPAERLRRRFGNGEWEALVGGSLLNKVGAVVLVIGIALFLAYSFGRMNAAGRATLALSASAAILGAGIWTERRARYRLFARGLIGAGWATLYATAYAIYALPAARIIENPFVGASGLLLVAAGMIGHSLRYRSQAVTATAYFAAFAALAATPSTPFAVVALVPLAASLLYLANRFEWNSMALFGLAATYATCIARGSSNAPLASTQSLFLAYWLLFEGFDLLRVRKRLFAAGLESIAPLNAAALLGLSYLAWSQKAPEMLWLAAACGAALYLADAIVRALLLAPSALESGADLSTRLRQGSYEFPLALAAVLAGLAIVGKVTGVWTSVGLAVEAELLYLAGVRFNAAFMRGCGMAGFAFSLGRLATNASSYDQSTVLGRATWNWTPLAIFHAFLFYVNRALKRPNALASSMAAGLAAAAIAAEMPARYMVASWLLFGLVLLELGLRKRLAEFRVQAYVLAFAGVAASAYLHTTDHMRSSWIGLALSLAVAYTYALRSRWNGGSIDDGERGILATGASAATAALAAILIWNTVPAVYVSMAWILLALVLFEAGNRALPGELRTISWAIATLGGGALVAMHADSFVKFAGVEVWASYLVACLAAWAMAARAALWPPANISARERTAFTDIMSASGAFAAMAFLWLVLPDPTVSIAWAVLGVAVAESFGLAGSAVLALTLARTFTFDLVNPERVVSTLPVIAAFYSMAYRLRDRLGRVYLWAASATLAALLYASVSGGLFTVALGLEGLALLGAGFGLRERILRLQGLSLLLACILKLFVYDLRNLETMYRILSFIVLGLILLGVSWIYTRFREHVRRLL